MRGHIGIPIDMQYQEHVGTVAIHRSYRLAAAYIPAAAASAVCLADEPSFAPLWNIIVSKNSSACSSCTVSKLEDLRNAAALRTIRASKKSDDQAFG